MSIEAIQAITPNSTSQNANNSLRGTTDKRFDNLLSKAIDDFAENMEKADSSLNKAIVGDSEQYLDYLVQTEMNSMNLQLSLQMRNKVVDAYNEIMRMQL
ncbi:MAG: flagellar hook-basal body complex protein FliE [Clostridia bacterium]